MWRQIGGIFKEGMITKSWEKTGYRSEGERSMPHVSCLQTRKGGRGVIPKNSWKHQV